MARQLTKVCCPLLSLALALALWCANISIPAAEASSSRAGESTSVPAIAQRFSPPAKPEYTGRNLDYGIYDCLPAAVAMVLQGFQDEGQLTPTLSDANRYQLVRRTFRQSAPDANEGISPNVAVQLVPSLTNGTVKATVEVWNPTSWQNLVAQRLQDGQFVVAVVPDWRGLVAERRYSDAEAHAVVITALQGGQVTYDDPWTGQSYQMDADAFGKTWQYWDSTYRAYWVEAITFRLTSPLGLLIPTVSAAAPTPLPTRQAGNTITASQQTNERITKVLGSPPIASAPLTSTATSVQQIAALTHGSNCPGAGCLVIVQLGPTADSIVAKAAPPLDLDNEVNFCTAGQRVVVEGSLGNQIVPWQYIYRFVSNTLLRERALILGPSGVQPARRACADILSSIPAETWNSTPEAVARGAFTAWLTRDMASLEAYAPPMTGSIQWTSITNPQNVDLSACQSVPFQVVRVTSTASTRSNPLVAVQLSQRCGRWSPSGTQLPFRTVTFSLESSQTGYYIDHISVDVRD